jgi:periplasmic divalent cation tolerance protein
VNLQDNIQMHQLIFCTCPDQKSADMLAEQLVTGKLAACVNILPGIRSVYTWQGELESAQEHLLLIKTHSDKFADLEAAIKQYHPYQLPEIIAVAVERGSADYLKWLDSCLHIN